MNILFAFNVARCYTIFASYCCRMELQKKNLKSQTFTILARVIAWANFY